MTAPALLPLTPLDWMRDAACADPDVDPEIFFPMGNGESDGDQTRAVDALRVCHGCAVQAKCREFAESTRDDWAVLGGTTAKARRAQRRNTERRAHTAAVPAPAPAPQRAAVVHHRGLPAGVEPKPCGTPAAYRRHRTRGENCEVCKRANREYYRQIEATRRAERGAA